ncbi:hypothetical protein HHX47_DHR7000603 [Lentinula edodes]|nr:hypothetical protein HHX47_DHR7000603 [Lentinula edodes]
MPHNHDHNCSHEHEHDHDDPDSLSTGAQDNLYQYIDRANVVALNADDDYKGSDAIKPWHERASEDKFANQDNLDFQDVTDKKPTQEFDVAQGREVGEYAVK